MASGPFRYSQTGTPQKDNPAEAIEIWQRRPSWENFALTQLFTFANVGDGPMHRRRTSLSQAARRAGVTSGGSFNSSAACATGPAASAAHSTTMRDVFIIPLCLAATSGPRNTTRRKRNHDTGRLATGDRMDSC